MGLSYCHLASGSKGNSLYVRSGNDAILVDCGISARQAVLRMEKAGLNPGAIRAILVTHEHRDHMAGVRVLAKRLRCPVLATKATARAMGPLDGARVENFEHGRDFTVGELGLRAFPVSHDAADTVGLVVEAHGLRLGLATDLGLATRLVKNRLAGCHGLVVEFNHDPELLQSGPYPQWLKQRVKGRHGHLSNQEGAALVESLSHADLASVTLAHLSETNNRPELALKAVCAPNGCAVQAAGQHAPTPVISL